MDITEPTDEILEQLGLDISTWNAFCEQIIQQTESVGDILKIYSIMVFDPTDGTEIWDIYAPFDVQIKLTEEMKSTFSSYSALKFANIDMDEQGQLLLNATLDAAVDEDYLRVTFPYFSGAWVVEGANASVDVDNETEAIPSPSVNDVPGTGDNTNLGLWFTLMMGSALCMILLKKRTRFTCKKHRI